MSRMVAVAGKKFHQIIRDEVANMSEKEKEVLRYSSEPLEPPTKSF